jgi:hypothetical protein
VTGSFVRAPVAVYVVGKMDIIFGKPDENQLNSIVFAFHSIKFWNTPIVLVEIMLHVKTSQPPKFLISTIIIHHDNKCVLVLVHIMPLETGVEVY